MTENITSSTSANELQQILSRIMGVDPARIKVEPNGEPDGFTISFHDDEDDKSNRIFAKHMARFAEMTLAQFGCQITGRLTHEA